MSVSKASTVALGSVVGSVAGPLSITLRIRTLCGQWASFSESGYREYDGDFREVSMHGLLYSWGDFECVNGHPSVPTDKWAPVNFTATWSHTAVNLASELREVMARAR